jgi:pterin-4a-carbinolamine dehydratase
MFSVMTERISPREFHQADDGDDWRVVFSGACAHFKTGSFRVGVELVNAIGQLADAANHHPDVDLRYPGVTVRLMTHEVGGLSARDVELARQISAAARDLGVTADPSAVQTVQIAIDGVDRARLMPFWQAVLATRRSATRTSKIGTQAGRRSGFRRSTTCGRGATGSTSTSACRPTREKRGSRRRSRRAGTLSATRTRRSGGRSLTLTATRPT